MERRHLPGTDLRVSAVGFGAWALGGEHWGDDCDPAEGKAAVRAALDAGVTLFDTAPLSGKGRADTLLREALGSRIHDVVVATKVGVRVDGAHPVSDLSPAHVEQDVERSLRRLGLGTLPLVQVHWPCERGTPLADTLGALSRLREAGKIRWFGLCNYGPDVVEAHGAELASLQTPLSLVRREGLAALIPTAARRGVGVLAYEPLARGLLSGKYRALPSFPETDMRRRDPRFWAARFGQIAPSITRLRAMASQVGVPCAALAVAWVASRPGVTAALVGAKRPAQVAENVQAARLLARPDAARLLDAVGTRV